MSAGDRRILLVEDDPNDVLLMRRAFRAAGLPEPGTVLSDGEEAIAYLAGENGFADREKYPLPTLLLLDLKLPRRSGFEVLEWLRQQERTSRLPVVVLTSSRQPDDVNRAYDLRANSYLVKPATLEGLREMVRMLDLYWLRLNEGPAPGDA
jgi:CheY-like chemotaxis protein